MLIMRGPAALSHFRIERLLAQINYIVPQVDTVSAEYVHFLESRSPLIETEKAVLENLLAYGNPFEGGEYEPPTMGFYILVIPKPGKASAWSCNALSILQLCGLKKIHHIERGVAYHIDANEKLTWGDKQAIAELLYDNTTEIVGYDLSIVDNLLTTPCPEPIVFIPIPEEGKKALYNASAALGLNLNESKIDYLLKEFHFLERNPTETELTLFSTLHSEEWSYTLFNTQWFVDEVFKSQSLNTLLKQVAETNSRGVLSLYGNNSIGMIMAGEGINIAVKVAFAKNSQDIQEVESLGKGATTQAALFGFSVGNLEIPGFIQSWESETTTVETYATDPLISTLEMPLEYTHANNILGRPILSGYFRTLGAEEREEISFGFPNPMIVSGSLGHCRPMQSEGDKLQPGMVIILLEHCPEVIHACIALGSKNPISSLRVGSQGELMAVLSEWLHKDNQGGIFESLFLTPDTNGQTSLYYAIALRENKLKLFSSITRRENRRFTVIGKITEETILNLFCPKQNQFSVSLPLLALFGYTEKEPCEAYHIPQALERIAEAEQESTKHTLTTIADILFHILRIPAVADKSFLVTLSDRTATGLVVRDAMVGPWQVPVADCGITARSFDSYYGEALALGERAPLAVIDPKAHARMCVGEAITNIASASIGALSDIRFAVNWSGDCDKPFSRAPLWDAVQAFGQLCERLGTGILSSTAALSPHTGQLSTTVTAVAPVMDIRLSLTPLLQVNEEETVLLYIDLSGGQQRLGGSAFAFVTGRLDNPPPDVDEPLILKVFFATIQQLILEEKILAYHDRSDGGLLVTLCEMAFASHTGLHIDISALGRDPLATLFNEELGAIIQIRREALEAVTAYFESLNVVPCYAIGFPVVEENITIVFDETVIFSEDRLTLHKAWSETSVYLQALRGNPRYAKKQFELLEDREDPGLRPHLTFEITKEEESTGFMVNTGARPKLAILREVGTTGHTEMAAAFHRVGFDCIDVHMNDLKSVSDFKEYKGLVVCSGFSFQDALGAGQGFAKRILFNQTLHELFESFFHRNDTFTLGIGNGCQMLSCLKSLIPGAELWPHFRQNYSEQFEARLCLVEVRESPSLFFSGMTGSRLLVPVAHSEGRVAFDSEEVEETAIKKGLVSLRFVDNRGRKTKLYPGNPNGSPRGITGLTSTDGRATILMPQPERGFRSVQYSWHPKEWGEDAPWLLFFQNARRWVE